MRVLRLAAVLMLLVVAIACGSDLHVTTVQLGRSLNADDTVATHTTRFTPNETIYVSVVVAGAGSGTVSVRWSYMDRVVGEPKKEISSAGATEFHLQNAGGFPPGEYTVEAFLNGVSAEKRTFQVAPPPR
jgi:hypothetical protein